MSLWADFVGVDSTMRAGCHSVTPSLSFPEATSMLASSGKIEGLESGRSSGARNGDDPGDQGGSVLFLGRDVSHATRARDCLYLPAVHLVGCMLGVCSKIETRFLCRELHTSLQTACLEIAPMLALRLLSQVLARDRRMKAVVPGEQGRG